MLKTFMIRYLQRRGYLVLKNHIPMLVVSGNGFAFFNKDIQLWQISFPVEPYIVALNGSYISKLER